MTTTLSTIGVREYSLEALVMLLSVGILNLAIFPFLPNYLLTSFIPQDKVPSATPAVSSAVVLDNKSIIVETLIYIIRSISI